MAKRAKVVSNPKKIGTSGKKKEIKTEAVTTKKIWTRQLRAKVTRDTRPGLVTKGKAVKAKKISTENEDVVFLPRKKPVVVDLDPVDLQQYIDNKVDSIKNEPKITDINRDISEYIDKKIKEKLWIQKSKEKSEEPSRPGYRRASEAAMGEEREQIRAALNAKKMLCECCPNGNHHANLANLTWHTVTQKWSDDQGEVQPMTAIKAWVHAKKMVANIKRGVDPNNTWYKCLMCDERDNNLIDVHFGVEQIHRHIIKYHRTTVNIYRDICNGLEWAEKAVTRRFQHIMMNVHREDYDNQLWRAKGRSNAAKAGNTGTRVEYHDIIG